MATVLTQLEQRLTADLTRYHVRTQALRLLAGAASTFAMQLATGTNDLGWKALLATAFGILLTGARQIWPTLPWNLVAAHLHAAQAAQIVPRTGMAANPPAMADPVAPPFDTTSQPEAELR